MTQPARGTKPRARVQCAAGRRPPIASPSSKRIIAATLVVAAAAVALWLALRERPPDTAPDEAPAPAEAPEDLLLEASLGGGRSWLGQLGDRLGGSDLALLLPRAPAGAVDRMVPLPPSIVERIPDDAALRAVVLGPWEDPQLAVAVAVQTTDDEAHPLGQAVKVEPGERGGAARVVVGGGSAVALQNGVLVAARDASVLGRAAPYLVHRVGSTEAPTGLWVRLRDGAVAGRLRSQLDSALSDWVGDARRAARAERRRHDEPPTYGDPEEVIAVVHEAVRERMQWMPDIGEVVARLETTRAGLVLSVDAAVQPGSPLARRLGDHPTGELSTLGALPAGTALGWTDFGGEADEPEEPASVADTLARVAGDRLEPSGREAIATLESALRATLPAPRAIGIGTTDDGSRPWALVAAAGGEPLELEPVQSALGTPWIGEVGGAVLGCAGGLEPGPWQSTALDGGGTRHAAPLCAASPPAPAKQDGPGRADDRDGDAFGGRPHLAVSTGPRGTAIAIARGDAGGDADGAPPLGARTVGRLAAGAGGSDGLGASVDVERALGSIEEPALWAAVIAPSRVLGAATLLGLGPLRSLARRLERPGPSSPVIIALVRTEGGVGLRVVPTPGSVDATVESVRPFAGAAMGPSR